MLFHSGLAAVRKYQRLRLSQAPGFGAPTMVKCEAFWDVLSATQLTNPPCKVKQRDQLRGASYEFAVTFDVLGVQSCVLSLPPTHHPPQQRLVAYRIALEMPSPFYFLHFPFALN